MDAPGQRLKQARERLNLTYRDVVEAGNQIANRHNNDEFQIALSRLSDIENKGTVPSIFRLYSLCTIYRLDISEVLEWYGVSLAQQPGDAASIAIGRTHPISFNSNLYGEIQLPLSLDPGIDLKKTTFLSRAVQRWGRLPASFLNVLDLKHLRYAFVGSEDWSMYPILHPESLVLIDETVRKIASGGWLNEYERPIYFIEHRTGYFASWCSLSDRQIIIQPHPSSACAPRIFPLDEVDIIGQVTGVAMRFESVKRRNFPA